MKINKVLESEIKNMEGNLLGIGDYDESVLKCIEKNDKITTCNILSNNMSSNETGKKRGKKIYLSKLRKKIKKKKVNYLVCNYKELENHLNTFIKDSIYITKDFIYFCTTDKEKIIRRYKRYDVDLKEIKCSDGYILIINTKEAKNNKLKEFIYKIIDYTIDIVEIITELLLN